MAKAKRKIMIPAHFKKQHPHDNLKEIQEMRKAQRKDYEHAALFGQPKFESAEKQVDPVNRRHTSRRAPSNILQTAESLIYGARNKTYRHPTENFDNIANLWNAYFQAIKRREGVMFENTEHPRDDANVTAVMEFKINKIDVAYMNILQKIARGATNQEHEDMIVDIAGYAGCIERIVQNK